MTLAVVILTKDEEAHVGECIASARLLEPAEVLVVDSGSRDRTREIAAEAGARVHWHEWLGYSGQRNLAMDLTRCEWVLFLDADERATPALADEVKRFLAAPAADAARMPRRNWFLGQPLCCRDPDWQLRLVRRGKGRWVGEIHERLRVDGPVASLSSPLLHFQSDDLAVHLAKHQAYARKVAAEALGRGERFSAPSLLRPFWAVPRFLLLRGGWRDGLRGVAYAGSYVVYGLQKALFMLEAEIRRGGRRG